MMAYELIYTSAPQGLQPGSRGFCTVAATADLPRTLQARLESLSGYRHVFPPHDERADLNPVVCSHLRVTADGQTYHVLSRIADAGLDYTKRSNKIAHHLALAVQDLGAAGPAWLLSQAGLWRSDWHEEPQVLPQRSRLPDASCGADTCPTWVALTGDATWAAALAEAVGERDAADISLIFRPGMNTLGLVQEALNLLRPEDRWKVTFSTYYTQLPPWVECSWRFLLEGSPEAADARRAGRGPIFDLCRPSPAIRDVRRSQIARTGRAEPAAPGAATGSLGPSQRPQRPASGAAFVSPLRSQAEPSPLAVGLAPGRPRRSAALPSRLVTVGVCGLVALAVAFLGYQILDWQSSRERKRSSAVAVATDSAVFGPTHQWRPEPLSADDPHDRTDADSDSAPESRRNQVQAPDALRDKPGSGDSGAAGIHASDLTPPPPRRTDDPAVEHAAEPPPPKPKKQPFAELKQAAKPIQPPETSVTGAVGAGGSAARAQPIGTMSLDQPQRLRLTLIGEVLGGGRRFEVSGPQGGPEGDWHWTVQCKSGITNEVGKFRLEKTPTAEDRNCCTLSYRWTSSSRSTEYVQLVNCLLGLKVPSEGEAEGASWELPLRLAPDPETRPFELWPDAPGTRYLLAVVPVSQLPKTGTVKLTLSIDGFAKPIEHQFTLDHAVSRRTDVAAPAKQPFLADPFAHVGVRAMAEIDDRQSAIRVWIDLLPWNGDAAVESRPISREVFNEFCQSPRREIRLIEESLPTLKRQIDDQQTAVNKLSKQLRDQQEFVDAAIEAAGRRKLLKGKENAKKLPAEEKAEEKLKEIAGYLRNAEVEKGRLDGELAARENLKAEYQNLAEKVKKCVEMLASLRLKAIAMASIPRKSGSDAETYDLPLATVNFTPP